MAEVTPEQLKQLGRGGVWTDENLAQSLDWNGEQGSPEASRTDEVTHVPQTEKQQEDSLLELHQITPETIAILTRRIQQSLLSTGNTRDSSVIGMIERRLTEKEAQVDAWLAKREDEMKRKEVTADEIEKIKRDINRIDEKLTTLDTRLSHNLVLATKHGSEEASLLHQVRDMLKARQAIDESEQGSLPSIVGRLEERTDQIITNLNVVEDDIQQAGQSIAADMKIKRNITKKFGRGF